MPQTLYAAPYSAFISLNGTKYQANSNGVIVNVADNDVQSLSNSGCTNSQNIASSVYFQKIIDASNQALAGMSVNKNIVNSKINIIPMGDSRKYLNCTNQEHPFYYKFANGVENQIQSLVGERFRFGIEQQWGVSGATVQGMVAGKAAIDAIMAKRPIDEEWYGIFTCGINDAIGGVTINSFETDFITFMKYCLNPLNATNKAGMKGVFVFGEVPYPSGYSGESVATHAARIALIKGYNARMKAFCDITPNLFFIDLYELYGFGQDTVTHTNDIHEGSFGAQIKAVAVAVKVKEVIGAFAYPAGVPISQNPRLTTVETSFNSSSKDSWYCDGFTAGVQLARSADGALLVTLDATDGVAKTFNIFNDSTTTIPLRGGDIVQGLLDVEILEVVGMPAFPQLKIQTSAGGYFAWANSDSSYGKGGFLLGRQKYMTQEFEVRALQIDKIFQPYLRTTALSGTKLVFKVWECSVLLIKRLENYVQEKTANYTLALQDINSHIRLNSGSAIALTVPPEATALYFPIGAEISLEQAGAGAASLVAGAGVTLQKKSTLNISARYGVARIRKIGANEWVCFGDLS